MKRHRAPRTASDNDVPIVYDERFMRALTSDHTHFELYDRTDIGAHIQKHWLPGGAGAIMGTQYVTLDSVEGVVRAKDATTTACERRDVARLYLAEYFNVFVNADGTPQIDGGFSAAAESVKTCDWKRALVFSRVEHELCAPAVQAHLERHRRFFDERPWRALDGLTPEAAVATWRELGWMAV